MNFELTKEEKETKRLIEVFSYVLWLLSIISYVIVGKFILEIFDFNEAVVVLTTAIISSLLFVDVVFQLTKYWKEPYHKRLDKELNEHLNSEYYGN